MLMVLAQTAAAVVDTTAGAALQAINAQQAIVGLLQAAAPWLSGDVVTALATLLASFPIVSMMFTWEWLAAKLRDASPWLNEHLGKKFEKWAFIINPVLGVLIGINMGNPLLGLAGGTLWGMIRSGVKSATDGKVDLAHVARSKVSAALLACSLLLLGAGQAAAADAPKQSLFSKFTLSVGGGLERDLVSGAPVLGFAAVQPGFTLTNSLALRVRLSRPFEKDPAWRGEAAVWFVF